MTHHDEYEEAVSERLPDGLHVEDIPVKVPKKRAKGLNKIYPGHPSLTNSTCYCHICGQEIEISNFHGEYYYCLECSQKYEQNPTICPVCGRRLYTDWDGPYCLECSRHFYSVKTCL